MLVELDFFSFTTLADMISLNDPPRRQVAAYLPVASSHQESYYKDYNTQKECTCPDDVRSFHFEFLPRPNMEWGFRIEPAFAASASVSRWRKLLLTLLEQIKAVRSCEISLCQKECSVLKCSTLRKG